MRFSCWKFSWTGGRQQGKITEPAASELGLFDSQLAMGLFLFYSFYLTGQRGMGENSEKVGLNEILGRNPFL